MTVVLEARSLSAGYNGQAVVHDLDLTVREGEIVALLGPNGAGKSTTLLTLAGELPSIGGEMFLFGSLTTDPLYRRVRKGLGFVPDDRSVVMGMTVRDNLCLRKGVLEEGIKHFPELEAHIDRPVAQLSGGQQQMVAMARTLGARPRLLLADELSLGLAPQVVSRLLDVVSEAAADGVGILLVEQQVTHALAAAHRAYVMRNGKVVMSGTADELRTRVGDLEAAYLAGDAPSGDSTPSG